MIIGVLEIEIIIPGCQSLKEKRMVLRSIKAKIKNKFDASVAETDYEDKWQRSALAFVVVSNKKSRTEAVLQKIFHKLDRDFSYEIIKHNFEYK
jgi:uncharacterized protein